MTMCKPSKASRTACLRTSTKMLQGNTACRGTPKHQLGVFAKLWNLECIQVKGRASTGLELGLQLAALIVDARAPLYWFCTLGI